MLDSTHTESGAKMLKVCKTELILYDVSEIDEPPTPKTALAGPTAEDAMCS
jgi:hypothetical protein